MTKIEKLLQESAVREGYVSLEDFKEDFNNGFKAGFKIAKELALQTIKKSYSTEPKGTSFHKIQQGNFYMLEHLGEDEVDDGC